ncbi:hypothetical protein DW732_01240 [Collinsella sp. AM28-11LB]|nr:hypothetical protein DW732_01240 [Collinsella sp. AM28-11LB]
MTYVYKQASKTWERRVEPNKTDPKDTLDDATMHSYLQSASTASSRRTTRGKALTRLSWTLPFFRAWVIKVTRSVALSLVI